MIIVVLCLAGDDIDFRDYDKPSCRYEPVSVGSVPGHACNEPGERVSDDL